MSTNSPTETRGGGPDLLAELESLRAQFEEADQILTAIRCGAVDGVVVDEPAGERVYMLKSADLARSILEQAAEAIVICDRGGRILQASRVAEELHGGPVIGGLFSDVFPLRYGTAPWSGSPHREGEPFDVSVVLSGETLRGVEARMPAGAPRPLRLLLSAGPLRNERDRIVGAVVTFVDITERVSTVEALRESEELKRRIVESSHDCIKLLDLDGNLLSINPGGQRGLEIDHLESVLRTNWLDFFSDEDRRQAATAIGEARAGRTARFLGYCPTRRGTPKWWDSIVTAIPNASGKPERLLVVSRDVTEQRQIEQRLKAADRRKTEFIAMLGHELRNPLAPLRSGLDLLAMSGESGEIVGLMQRQFDHLVRLVDDLLDVSRIIQGKIELRRQPVELASIVDQAIEFVRPIGDERRHTISCELPSEPVWLEADPVRLAQVITNLLNNAVKYTNDGGSIAVTAELDGGEVVIRVRDNGIGMPPELLPRIFDLFVQAPSANDRSGAGLGLGLALARNLVELHGGTIAAHSDGPRTGSEFVVRLPALPHAEQAPAADGVSHRAASSPARRILIVDDNAAAARLLKLLLSKLGGHDVAVAHDGPAALEAARERRPEIVFLDIGLPGMNGYEVGRKLRADPDFEQTLLVALTGYGQEEDRERARRAGFDEHLVKPPALESIEAILSHPRLRPRS